MKFSITRRSEAREKCGPDARIEIGKRVVVAFCPDTIFRWPPWGSYEPIKETGSPLGTHDYYFLWFRLRILPTFDIRTGKWL